MDFKATPRHSTAPQQQQQPKNKEGPENSYDPPELSEKAFLESKSEREEYEKRFNDECEPEEFNDKYLDVDLAIRMLSRNVHRQTLICEVVFYVALVALYCYYLFTSVTLIGGYEVSFLFKQALAERPFSHRSFYYDQLGPYLESNNQTFTICELPFNGENYKVIPGTGSPTTSEPSLSPTVSPTVSPTMSPLPTNSTPPPTIPSVCNPDACVYCTRHSEKLNFVSVRSLEETNSFLRMLLTDSSLFPRMPGNSTVSTPNSNYQDGGIVRVMPDYSFVPLGAVRLRQIRVQTASCDPRSVDNADELCAKNFSPETEFSASPFIGSAGKEYYYTSASEATTANIYVPTTGTTVTVDSTTVSSRPIQEALLYDYPLSGYIIDIEGGNRSQAAKVYFEDILANDWIDSSTAMLEISFTLYSLNLNVYVQSSYVVEFTSSGSVVPQYHTLPFRLLEDEKNSLWLEILILSLGTLLLLYFINGVFVDLRTMSFYKALFGWTMYDILNISLVITSIAVRLALRLNPAVQETTSTTDVIQGLMTVDRGIHTTFFDAYSDVLLMASALSAISLIVCFFKFFKYVDLNKRFSIALASIMESRTSLTNWLLITIIVVFAFVFFMYFCYGYYSVRYSRFGNALTSVLLFVVQVYAQPLNLIPSPRPSVFTASRLGVLDFQLNYFLFEVSDNTEALFFAKSLMLALLFVCIVAILITNLFQAILIFGYQNVFAEVVEDENLRREQRDTQVKSRHLLKQSWTTRQVKIFQNMASTAEKRKIISRLSSAPECAFRNLLSYFEVLEIMKDIVPSEERAVEITVLLMSLYQTQLSRIQDATVICKDIEIANREGRKPFVLAQTELPIVRLNEVFDPSKKEKWIRDLQSGDVMQSLLFVHCLQLERSSQRFTEAFHKIQTAQEQIAERSLMLENAVRMFQQKEMRKRGDNAFSADPWDPRSQSVVEPRIDGQFDAHHVSADGTHRYLGVYSQASRAERGIQEMDQKLQKEEEKKKTATDLSGLIIGLGNASKSNKDMGDAESEFDDSDSEGDSVGDRSDDEADI